MEVIISSELLVMNLNQTCLHFPRLSTTLNLCIQKEVSLLAVKIFVQPMPVYYYSLQMRHILKQSTLTNGGVL